ncbi:hypothetical protein [Pararhizobium sp.]|uniref:hypothetical protein n=1 Tax=Pararhizobium sp. TaxID=1977563 RepID=UPI00271CAE93|nr:hypothetical protein [Pararhizobium sp.]MDO9417081.1 hypothetical protein [Pararhizobium sp.]
MIKSMLAAATVAFLIAGPVYAQDAVMCDEATITKLETDVTKLTSTQKDPAESPTAEKNDMIAKAVSEAKVAMAAGDTAACTKHIGEAMEAMKEPG